MGTGLGPVLKRRGRVPDAGLVGLQNPRGGPGRIRSLAAQLGIETQRNLRRYAQEANIRPVVREVSEEALRMLDAYINRTDELHPWSTELLAQAFTGAAESMPDVGDRVPIPDFEESSFAAEVRGAVLQRMRDAGREAAENQIAEAVHRASVATRVAKMLGFFDIPGDLIDQRF